MRKRKISVPPLLIGGLILLISALAFWPAQPANAQCGSQASSCKNCHEVQAQDAVNNDSTSWHQAHAFGDFCALCHAGNSQATEKDAAHTGLESPMSDVKAACQQCHASDLNERAQVYAAALGVDIGTGSSSGSGTTAPDGGSAPSSGDSAAVANPPAPAAIVVSQPVIDYSQQYEQSVSGKRQINWGNVILASLLIIILAFGGWFIYQNEKKLRGSVKPTEEDPKTAPPIHAEDYPQEILLFLPQIAALNPIGRKALQRLLQHPDAAAELLHSLARLDPDLIRRVKTLDRESQALLLALAGD